MNEKRFVLDKLYYTIMTPIEKISVGRSYMTYREVVNCLNEQQSTITKLKELNDEKGKRIISLIRTNKTLKAQLREKEEDEKLYANEILELRETNKEHIKFKSLGGDY